MNRHTKHSKGSGYLKYSNLSDFTVRSNSGPEPVSTASTTSSGSRTPSVLPGRGGTPGTLPRVRKARPGLPIPKQPSTIAKHGVGQDRKVSGSGSKLRPPNPDQDFRVLHDQFERLSMDEYQEDADYDHYEANPSQNMWQGHSVTDFGGPSPDELSIGEAFLHESMQPQRRSAKNKNSGPILPTPPGQYLKESFTSANKLTSSGNQKSNTKVEYLPDYNSVRSELLTLVEKEKKRKPAPGSAVTPPSGTLKPKFTPLTASASATSFLRTPLHLTRMKPGEINIFNESEDRTKKVNEQLTQLAKIFRENLKAGAKNPTDVIKVPKISQLNDKAWEKLGKNLTPESLTRTVSSMLESDEEEEEHEDRQKAGSMKRSTASKSKSGKKELLDESAGLMELRTLLSRTAQVGESKQQKSENQKGSLRKPPPPPTQPADFQMMPEELGAHDRDPYLHAQNILEAYRQNERDEYPGNQPTDMDILKRQLGESKASSANGSRTILTQTNSLDSVEQQQFPWSDPSRKIPKPGAVTKVVQNKIGKSITTMDDAAKVANALGSLMSRVAASRNEASEDEDSGTLVPSSKFNYSKAKKHVPGKVSGFGTQTSGQDTQGIQTDFSMSTSVGKGKAMVAGPVHLAKLESLREKIAQIQFTKDMSPEDQEQLQQLRRQKQEWENYKFQA